MNCSCEVDVGHDGEVMSFCKQKVVKARNPHICYECGKIINPGKKYETTTGCWDGVFSTFKTCSDCLSLRSFFTSWIFCSVWEEFRNYIEDCEGEMPEDCIAELTPVARAKVCEIIEEYWEWEES